jgi:hypothetical protein
MRTDDEWGQSSKKEWSRKQEQDRSNNAVDTRRTSARGTMSEEGDLLEFLTVEAQTWASEH